MVKRLLYIKTGRHSIIGIYWSPALAFAFNELIDKRKWLVCVRSLQFEKYFNTLFFKVCSEGQKSTCKFIRDTNSQISLPPTHLLKQNLHLTRSQVIHMHIEV